MNRASALLIARRHCRQSTLSDMQLALAIASQG